MSSPSSAIAEKPDLSQQSDNPGQEIAPLENQQSPVQVGVLKRAHLKPALLILLSVLISLAVAEGMTRAIMCAVKPVQYGSKELDAKMAIAGTPLPANTPCIYFLGSSHTARAIYAELIAERLKKAGYNIEVRNLAAGASYPADELMILDHAIKTSPGPFTIAYECLENGFSVARSAAYDHGPQIKSSVYLKNSTSDWPVLKEVDIWLKQNIYLIRYRSQLKEKMHELCENIFAPAKFILPGGYTKSAHGDVSVKGFSPVYSTLDEATYQKTRDYRFKQTDLFDFKTEKSERRQRYYALENVFKYANEHSAKVAMIWMPVHPRFRQALEEKMETTEEQMSARIANAARLDNAALVDVHKVEQDDKFSDCDHLNVLGAIETSKQIADGLLAQRETLLDPLVSKTK